MALNSKQIVLSGDVAYIRIIINVENENGAWDVMLESMLALRRRVEELTNQELGSQVTVRSMTPIRGSIEVMVVIGAVYYAVASYEDFLGGVERLASQLRRLFSSAMNPFVPTVTSSVTMGPAAASVPMRNASAEDLTKMILLGYLILSHAALLAMFIWMLSKKIG